MRKEKTYYQMLKEDMKKTGEKPSRFLLRLVKTADEFIAAQRKVGLSLSDVMEK